MSGIHYCSQYKSDEVYIVFSKYITVIQGVLQSIYGPIDTFVKNKT